MATEVKYDVESHSQTSNSKDEQGTEGTRAASIARLRTLAGGARHRLGDVAQRLELSDLEASIMLLAALSDLDPAYVREFAQLQGDASRVRPTVDLLCEVLELNLVNGHSHPNPFEANATLVHQGVIEILDDPYSPSTPLGLKQVALTQRVLDFLIGSAGIDPAIEAAARTYRPNREVGSFVAAEPELTLVQELVDALRASPSRGTIVVELNGAKGVGKSVVAEIMASALDQSLLEVSFGALPQNLNDLAAAMDKVYREARLSDACVAIDIDENSILSPGIRPQQLDLLESKAWDFHGLTVFCTTAELVFEGRSRFPIQTLRLPNPSFLERDQLWRSALGAAGLDADEAEVTRLASTYRLNGGQIDRVMRKIGPRELDLIQNDRSELTKALTPLIKSVSHGGLGTIAQRVTSDFGWEDLVLPEDPKAQLLEMVSHFEHSATVYQGWKFQAKSGRGHGISALFSGQSGTGKTMSAEVIANSLGLDLYRIDLAGMVSKYIGETEKNLDKLFAAAEGSNAILFFDEADSIFGKRSEVRDAHDRYANLEVSYLLQKMEDYEGIVILATNFRNNIDDAFVRRLRFAIDFPFPDKEYRHEIWKRSIPAEAPLDEDVDLLVIASQFDLAGGNIKNIAISAAFLAAADGRPIATRHIMQAARREYQKMGRLPLEKRS